MINTWNKLQAASPTLHGGGGLVCSAASRPPLTPWVGLRTYQDFGGSGGAETPTHHAGCASLARKEDSGSHFR